MKPMHLREFCREMLEWVEGGYPKEVLRHGESMGLCGHYVEFLRNKGKSHLVRCAELEKLHKLFYGLYGSWAYPFNGDGRELYYQEAHKYTNPERLAFLRRYAK